MAAVHYDSDDTHYQWNEYDEFEEGHLAYDLADDLDEEHLAAIASLTLKDLKTMKAIMACHSRKQTRNLSYKITCSLHAKHVTSACRPC